MPTEVLTAVTGVSTLFGLLSLVAYLYYKQHTEKVERSIREALEGEGPFIASEVVSILKEFTTDEARLKALKEVSSHPAKILSAVKDNVDLEKFNNQNAATYLAASRIAAIFFIAVAAVGLGYVFLTITPVQGSKPTGTAAPSPPEPVLSFVYDSPDFTGCTGSFDKANGVWTESSPDDAACDVAFGKYVDLGSDENWYYLYDPGKDKTLRLPKLGGPLNSIEGKLPPNGADSRKWDSGIILKQYSAEKSGKSPEILYTYHYPAKGTMCVGRIEKTDTGWHEMIPQDAACEFKDIPYEDLGSDAGWYYIYDPVRKLGARVPRKNGNVNWTWGRYAATETNAANWYTGQALTRIR